MKPQQNTIDTPLGPLPYTEHVFVPTFVQALMTQKVFGHTAGDYSVTQLLDDPRCALLEQLHPECGATGPERRMPLIMGRALHEFFENHIHDPTFVKEHTFMEAITVATDQGPLPKILTGTPDLIQFREADGHIAIYDFKTWSVHKWRRRDFSTAMMQLSIYAHLLRTKRQSADISLSLLVFLKDWNVRDFAIAGPENYPANDILLINFKPFEDHTITAFLTERITLFESYVASPESSWPDAPMEATWSEPEAYRVYKNDSTRAIRGGVFRIGPTMTESEAADAAKQAACKAEVADPKSTFRVVKCNSDQIGRASCRERV
jgi:hypothetical protein